MLHACNPMAESPSPNSFGCECQPVSSRAITPSGPSSRTTRQYLVIRQEQVANHLIGRPPADRADIGNRFDSTQDCDTGPDTRSCGPTLRQVLVELHQQPTAHLRPSILLCRS